MQIVPEELDSYSCRMSTKVEKLFEDLRKETYEKTSNPGMQVGAVEGRFLRLLVMMTGAKRVLEVGTFTGYSALMMASALPDDGVLLTLDRDEYSNAIARRYFGRAPFGSRIKTIMGDARETIKTIQGPIDFAFIDADKESYDIYYEAALELLSPGKMMALDNTLWSGGILDPQDHASRSIDAINRKIAKDKRVEAVLLTVRDGVTLVRKK